MDATKLTLAALLAASLAGNVYLGDKGSYSQVVLVDGAPSRAELTGGAAAPLADALAEAEATEAVTCKRGYLSNQPEALYCSDGVRVGFLVDESAAAALEDEASEKAGGSSDGVRVEVDGGKVYASGVP